QTVQGGLVISRTHFARELKFSGLVISNQECAEAGTTALWIGVAANHEFLFIDALELQPVSRPPRGIDAVAILGDDSLPAFSARFAIIGLSAGLPVLAKAKRIFERQCLCQ